MGNMLQVVKASLAQEREAPPEPRRDSHERAFLPAAIEILETPANPAGRSLLWLTIAFFTGAVIWSLIGEVDVHATAQGRIVPAGRVKVIEPLETGTVSAIHVRDGDRVAKGEPLLEIDRTEAAADRERLARDLMTAMVETARLDAQILAVDANIEPIDVVYAPPGDADPDLAEGQRQLLVSAVTQHRAELAAIGAEITQRRAERDGAKATYQRQAEMVEVLSEMVAQRRALNERGSGSRVALLESSQRLHEEEANLARAEGTWRGAEAAITALDRKWTERRTAFLAGAIAEREDVRKRVAGLREELKKAVLRDQRTRLLSPVDGTVLQLAVHTVGSVVSSGERLMVVVPEDVGLEVEAMLLNKDKGFVGNDATAEVKLEAFPFTKYGTIPGRIQLVSNDAVENEALGLVFPARVSLARETIRVDGQDVALTPGMSATVEIKTGKRKVIEYLLTPLLRYRDEAIRER